MSRGERGQSLVEAVVAVPLCLACAWSLVDCGSFVRDRVAVGQAASRAAGAALAGATEAEVVQAAQAALPGFRQVRVARAGDSRLVVSAGTRASILAPMLPDEVSSEVVLEVEGGVR